MLCSLTAAVPVAASGVRAWRAQNASIAPPARLLTPRFAPLPPPLLGVPRRQRAEALWAKKAADALCHARDDVFPKSDRPWDENEPPPVDGARGGHAGTGAQPPLPQRRIHSPTGRRRRAACHRLLSQRRTSLTAR